MTGPTRATQTLIAKNVPLFMLSWNIFCIVESELVAPRVVTNLTKEYLQRHKHKARHDFEE
jgi:hypothetical protein